VQHLVLHIRDQFASLNLGQRNLHRFLVFDLIILARSRNAPPAQTGDPPVRVQIDENRSIIAAARTKNLVRFADGLLDLVGDWTVTDVSEYSNTASVLSFVFVRCGAVVITVDLPEEDDGRRPRSLWLGRHLQLTGLNRLKGDARMGQRNAKQSNHYQSSSVRKGQIPGTKRHRKHSSFGGPIARRGWDTTGGADEGPSHTLWQLSKPIGRTIQAYLSAVNGKLL